MIYARLCSILIDTEIECSAVCERNTDRMLAETITPQHDHSKGDGSTGSRHRVYRKHKNHDCVNVTN